MSRLAAAAVVFVLSALAPFLLLLLRARRWGLAVHVYVDRDDPRPKDICGYLAEIARRLDERPERMRVTFDGRNREGRAIALDIEKDRRLRVTVEGRRAESVDLRARWIADHPVPLDLRRAVLYIDPVDANRFRAMTAPPFAVPGFVHLLCSLLAAAGLVLFAPEPVALALGASIGCAAAKAAHCRGRAIVV